MSHELPPQPEAEDNAVETEQVQHPTCEPELGQAAIESIRLIEAVRHHHLAVDLEGRIDDALAKALGISE